MSSGQARGRGGARGGEGRGSRGGQQGARGGAGPSPGQGRGRGDGQSRGRGDRGGDRGRGHNTPPRAGQGTQMAIRGPPPDSEDGGIYIGPAPPPNPQVTAAENALVAVTRDQVFDGIPGRRGYGTKGKPIVLRTNYLELSAGEKDVPLYKYDVSITQDLSKPKKRRLLEEIVKLDKFNDKKFATDYANIIVTTEPVDLESTEGWVKKVTLPPADGNGGDTGDDQQVPEFVQEARRRNLVEFRVKYGGSRSLQELFNYLRSTSAGADYAGRADLIQMLNIILSKTPQESARVAKVGQNKFYPFHGHVGLENYQLGGGLEALRGYYSSVRPAINRLLVNLNVTSGAFYRPLPLGQLMEESGINISEQLESFLRHLKVKAVYKKDGKEEAEMTKTKTIVGFAKPDPPEVRVKRFGNANEVKFTFNDTSGATPRQREVTVAQYFRQVRGITLKRPNLPVLNVATRKDPQYLPVEICTVLPGQPYRRILGGEQTSEMIKFAARFPNLNAMSIAGTQQAPGNGVLLLRLADPPGRTDTQSLSVKPFGFSVSTQMVTVPGRILDSPRVEYGNKHQNPRFGSWNCADQRFSVPGRHGNWQVLIINLQGPRGNALNESPNPQSGILAPEPLVKELEKYLKSYGITMGQRMETQSIMLDQLTLQNRNINNRKIEGAFLHADKRDVRMLFIVLPQNDKWLYARIKFYGDIKFGIHTINAVGTKLQKPNGQGMFMGNLALKFNIKGGGVSHKIPGVLSKPLDNNTMLMGIDVTHPSPGSSEGGPSIAAVVASVDENLFHFPGSVRTQKARQEMVGNKEKKEGPMKQTVDNLAEMVLERLDLWRRKHGKLPTKIVLYRDGVSEGQYDQVLNIEMPSFYEAFKQRYGDKPKWPKVAVVVVGKRHHTRFYPTRQEDADYNPQRQKGSWNPLPGTVVDRGIADKVKRELWLQAHQGLQGTARPAHYVVIKDDIKFEADELEQFTHKMCYLFNRATKAVSICPPAYYADLLCERGRYYLHSTLAENHGSDSSEYSASDAEWTGGVHERLRDSTWYI